MTRLTTLANGVRVVSQTMDHVETVALGLHVDTGARLETEATNGVAHLLEHMVFKGTETRSARAIAEEIEDVGGSLNAYTARDMTVFHARLLAEDTALGLGLIADLVRAPRFDAEEIEREKAVVLQELGEARDTPDDIVFDHLQAAAFPGQAIGRSILGDEASIAAITADDLRDWLSVQYRGGSCIVAAAGKVDHDALVTLSERLFGDLVAGARPAFAPAAFAPGVVHDRRRFEQAHLTLGAAAPGHHHPDHDAVALFVMAAGGGASSRLFQELREERGLAYSVYASTTPYADAGLFSVYLATAKKDAGRAFDLAVDVLATTAHTLRPDELARAKAQIRAGLLMSLESPGGWAEFLARQLLAHGRLQTPTDLVARIDAVDLDHVRAAAERLVAGRMPSPTSGLRRASALLRLRRAEARPGPRRRGARREVDLIVLTAAPWADYGLIDSGHGRKLERYGAHRFIRPEPQALWTPASADWVADGEFVGGSEEDGGGRWNLAANVPTSWPLTYGNVHFRATNTPFRHLGFFPDMACHWDWTAARSSARASVLNVFGYTGVGSLVCAAAGAAVTHLDASKKAIGTAVENQRLSDLTDAPIRWVVDDALKFVRREVRRGRRYDGIILDPPKYGRGPEGEVWELYRDLPELLTLARALLDDRSAFLVLTVYAIRMSAVAIAELAAEALADLGGTVTAGEMTIREEARGRLLPTAIFVRWEGRGKN